MSRGFGGRSQSRTFLILTEGESEVEYFNRFKGRDRHVAIVPIVAKRHDSKNLVTYCVNKTNERGIDYKNGDKVAIVIDVDKKTAPELKEIENQCADNGMDLYLSNRSFESWLILHFCELTKPSTQEELEYTLSTHLKHRYVKSEGINKNIDESNVMSAIDRAEKMISNEHKRNELCRGLDPSTTVHFLVKRIQSITES